MTRIDACVAAVAGSRPDVGSAATMWRGALAAAAGLAGELAAGAELTGALPLGAGVVGAQEIVTSVTASATTPTLSPLGDMRSKSPSMATSLPPLASLSRLQTGNLRPRGSTIAQPGPKTKDLESRLLSGESLASRPRTEERGGVEPEASATIWRSNFDLTFGTALRVEPGEGRSPKRAVRGTCHYCPGDPNRAAAPNADSDMLPSRHLFSTSAMTRTAGRISSAAEAGTRPATIDSRKSRSWFTIACF